MKVSLSWLSQYTPIRMRAADLAEALTRVGLAVDAVVDRFAFLETVRVGRILSVDPHPAADRLKVCQVDTGRGIVPVVCGAPNARADALAAVALPGTVMPDGSVLESGVLRGQRSEGMLCSAAELALGTAAGEIMILDGTPPVGEPLNRALGLTDPVLEIDLTPNRADCLSIVGVAREVAAIQRTRLTRPTLRLDESDPPAGRLAAVTIEAPDHCPRYAARVVEGVAVGPSPFWLQDRLRSVGLRPINTLVDVTNFVMLETGQPLHAFDLDRLAGQRIVVRTAAAGERFVTLDDKERVLDADMLMICDAEKPVAIAGVMGGQNSEIRDATTRVLIESAWFDPVSVRRTSKRLGLGTDASRRFERGVDPDRHRRGRRPRGHADGGDRRRAGGPRDDRRAPASLGSATDPAERARDPPPPGDARSQGQDRPAARGHRVRGGAHTGPRRPDGDRPLLPRRREPAGRPHGGGGPPGRLRSRSRSPSRRCRPGRGTTRRDWSCAGASATCSTAAGSPK